MLTLTFFEITMSLHNFDKLNQEIIRLEEDSNSADFWKTESINNTEC